MILVHFLRILFQIRVFLFAQCLLYGFLQLVAAHRNGIAICIGLFCLLLICQMLPVVGYQLLHRIPDIRGRK